MALGSHVWGAFLFIFLFSLFFKQTREGFINFSELFKNKPLDLFSSVSYDFLFYLVHSAFMFTNSLLEDIIFLLPSPFSLQRRYNKCFCFVASSVSHFWVLLRYKRVFHSGLLSLLEFPWNVPCLFQESSFRIYITRSQATYCYGFRYYTYLYK